MVAQWLPATYPRNHRSNVTSTNPQWAREAHSFLHSGDLCPSSGHIAVLINIPIYKLSSHLLLFDGYHVDKARSFESQLVNFD